MGMKFCKASTQVIGVIDMGENKQHPFPWRKNEISGKTKE